MNKINISSCWCGSTDLENYSPEYKLCKACSTLINSPRYENNYFRVTSDEESYYGKNYWLEHQVKDLGLMSVVERTRLDLSERCVYWLKCVLSYLSPNDRTLELGFGSGGLIALLDTVGYKSMGIELSEWLVEYVKNNYNINVFQGNIEQLDFEPSWFKSIMLFDVMEHLPDPVTTIKRIGELIADDGYLFIQTPCFRNKECSMDELVSMNDPFVKMMIDQEHLFLYTEDSLKSLLSRFGFNYFYTEQPLFQYDMFLVASKKPFIKKSIKEVESKLLETRNGRIILALIDLYDQKMVMEEQAILRLESVNKLETMLKKSEVDRNERLNVINELQKKLEVSEEDRENRLNLINELGRQLRESEDDRAKRLDVINELGEMLHKSEAERAEKTGKVTELQAELNKLKKDLQETEDKMTHLEEKSQEIWNKYVNVIKKINKNRFVRIFFKDHFK